MADQSLEVDVKANTVDLTTKMAMAKASVSAMSSEMTKLAKAANGAGGEMQASLVAKLGQTSSAFVEAKQKLATLNGELHKTGEEHGFLSIFDAMKGRLGAITEMTGKFQEFGEALIGAFAVERVAEFIDKISEAGAQALHLSQQLGMPVETVSKLGYAGKQAGLDLTTMASMLERLEKSSVDAADGSGKAAKAFADLGISAGDLKNLSPEQLLARIADAFAGAADGAAKTAIAIELMGRSGADMIPVLDQGSQGLAALAAQAAATGTVLTGPMAEGMERTSGEATQMSAAFNGVAITLYQAFKPAIDDIITGITGATEAFNGFFHETAAGSATLAGVTLSLDTVIEAFETMAFAVKESWEIAKEALDGMGDGMAGVASIASDIANEKFGAVGKDWARMLATMDVDGATHTGNMLSDLDAFATRTKALVSNINDDGTINLKGDADQAAAPKKPLDASNLADPSGSAQKSQVEAWQNMLTAQLLSEHKFGDAAKAEEAKFWSDRLAQVKGGSADEVKARAEITDKLYAIDSELYEKSLAAGKKAGEDAVSEFTSQIRAKQDAEKGNVDAVMADENRLLAYLKNAYGEDSKQYQAELTHKAELQKQADDAWQSSFDKQTSSYLAALDKQEAADLAHIDKQREAGQMSADAARDTEIAIVQAAEAQQLAALQAAEYLARGAEKQQEYAEKIIAIEQHATDAISDYKDKAADEDAARQKRLNDEIAQYAASSIMSMLEGRETFTQAAIKLADQLLENVLEASIKELLVVTENLIKQTQAAIAAEVAKNSAKAAGNVTGAAMDATANEKTVFGDAKVAAAGAYKALAGIPIVGPFLGAAAAASTFAAVMAFSAEGGMGSVPYDNAPFLLHAKEMVLPADIAESVRNMASNTNFKGYSPSSILGGGGAGGGAGFGGGDTHYHANINHTGPLSSDDIPDLMDNVESEMRNRFKNRRIG